MKRQTTFVTHYTLWASTDNKVKTMRKIKVLEVTEQKRHGILGAVYQPVRAYRLAESPFCDLETSRFRYRFVWW